MVSLKSFLQKTKLVTRLKLLTLTKRLPLHQNSKIKTRKFTYGLPELNREEIRKANNIANPGCFATTIQLGLLPPAKAGLLTDAYIQPALPVAPGQGRAYLPHHTSVGGPNIQAYKTLTHQHLGEIGESLKQLQPEGDIR